ncbi:MAG: hypothetical protein ACKOB4_03875 [Acidobacteriota bacterium]
MSISPIFTKLNLVEERRILVLNAPDSFEPMLGELRGVEIERTVVSGAKVRFALAFAVTVEERDRLAAGMIESTEGDAIIWIAYPKGTSKRYKGEFNRDCGWRVFGEAGFEPVRQVAIDEDWSALRFRRTEFIRRLTRRESMAISKEGKRRSNRPVDPEE